MFEFVSQALVFLESHVESDETPPLFLSRLQVLIQVKACLLVEKISDVILHRPLGALLIVQHESMVCLLVPHDVPPKKVTVHETHGTLMFFQSLFSELHGLASEVLERTNSTHFGHGLAAVQLELDLLVHLEGLVQEEVEGFYKGGGLGLGFGGEVVEEGHVVGHVAFECQEGVGEGTLEVEVVQGGTAEELFEAAVGEEAVEAEGEVGYEGDFLDEVVFDGAVDDGVGAFPLNADEELEVGRLQREDHEEEHVGDSSREFFYAECLGGEGSAHGVDV